MSIVAEAGAFPTDLYIVEGAMASAGRPMRAAADRPGCADRALLDERVAAVVLSHVDYRSGRLLDVADITRKVHAAGALVIWDLCHSLGVIEFRLRCRARRFRRRLHLQISQWRPGIAGVHRGRASGF